MIMTLSVILCEAMRLFSYEQLSLFEFILSQVRASYKLLPRFTGESLANVVNGSAEIFVPRDAERQPLVSISIKC